METFVGDTVRIVLDTKINILGYGTMQIRYRKPNGNTGGWVSSVYPGTTGSMYYTTSLTDLDIPGTWAVQAYVEGGGTRLHGLWDEFTVFKTLLGTYVLIAGPGNFV